MQKLIAPTAESDEFGRPVISTDSPTWQDVCRCRCDHSGDREIKDPDGNIARPEYHIILEGANPDIAVGDIARCIAVKDGATNAEGRVIRIQKLNRLPYAEIYI